MVSPFDFVKSILQTDDNLYTTDDMFKREYNAFMINRILSNSETTVLFAECMNKYTQLDLKLQYDFYRIGIPKSKRYTKMWSKKNKTDLNLDHINYVATQLNVSLKRATEMYKLLGPELVEAEILKQGGHQNHGKSTSTSTKNRYRD